MSYNRNKKKGQSKSKNNQGIRVEPEGSLGLLALGDIGLDMWRNEKKNKNSSSHG